MKMNYFLSGIFSLAFAGQVCAQTPTYENNFAKPLNVTLSEIAARFNVKLKYDIDTVGKMVDFADFRVRPYSVEESLTNVLSIFDYKFVKQDATTYKLKNYEYARRTDEDGVKMLAYLNTLYNDKASFEKRATQLRAEVRQRLGVDALLKQCVPTKPILSKIRKYDGYQVQNIAVETLPGLYVCGTIYYPSSKGKHALIICPNGHFFDGRYRKDQQQRMATLARMGAVCIDYDLFGWGESGLQVGFAAHQTSAAHVIQAMNGLILLDYMIKQSSIDTKRVGVNGGSGGGTQTILLSVLDNRFTAAAPVVSMSSHFDGGCPCESGMPVTLSGGGTNNAELMACFAPRPLLVVSDGGDWTASTPTLEYPYLQHIYGFYGATDQVTNVHLPNEKHDFGPNKREPVYAFFAKVFHLDISKKDESKVTIEPQKAMLSFGEKGELLPKNAIHSFREVTAFFPKDAYADVSWIGMIEDRATQWAASLNLNDDNKTTGVKDLIFSHLKQVYQWNKDHPASGVPAGMDPATGDKLNDLARSMIAQSAMPKDAHERLMKGLRRLLTEDQVDQVLDSYTIGKVGFTMKGYHAIVPDMTPTEEAALLGYLKQAREEAIDYKSMKQISAVFEIYKTKCEQYFNNHGRNWHQMFKAYVDKRNAEKAAEKNKK